MTEQQKRMGDCNKQASDKGMKGDDRSTFMSTCLKGGGDKTAACNTRPTSGSSTVPRATRS